MHQWLFYFDIYLSINGCFTGKQPTMGTGNVKDMLAMFESGRDGAIGQRLAHCDDESVIITNNSATPGKAKINI